MSESAARTLYELFNARRFDELGCAIAEDCEFHHRPQWPGDGAFKGRDGVIEAMRDLHDVIPGLYNVPSEFGQVAADTWIIRVNQGLADDSGQPRETETVFHLMRFDDSDRMRELRSFSTREEVLAAAQ